LATPQRVRAGPFPREASDSFRGRRRRRSAAGPASKQHAPAPPLQRCRIHRHRFR